MCQAFLPSLIFNYHQTSSQLEFKVLKQILGSGTYRYSIFRGALIFAMSADFQWARLRTIRAIPLHCRNGEQILLGQCLEGFVTLDELEAIESTM